MNTFESRSEQELAAVMHKQLRLRSWVGDNASATSEAAHKELVLFKGPRDVRESPLRMVKSLKNKPTPIWLDDGQVRELNQKPGMGNIPQRQLQRGSERP